jgi:hypothetical protein
LNDEISFIVCHLFRGSEIRDVEIAFVDPVVVRLDISVDYMALFVQILEGFRHLLDDFLGN